MFLQLKYMLHAVLTYLFPERMRNHPTGIAILAAKRLGITPAQFMHAAILANRHGVDTGMDELRRIKSVRV